MRFEVCDALSAALRCRRIDDVPGARRHARNGPGAPLHRRAARHRHAPPPPADRAPPGPPPASQPRAPRATGASQIPANGQRIALEVNKGTLVRLAGPAATVFVANPDIADVQVKSPTLVYITAKAPGETVIYAVDASDSVLLNAPILVEHDVSRLRSSLRQLAPGERISANSVDGNLVLSGVVSDAGQADKVRALAASIAGEVKGSQVINRMTDRHPEPGQPAGADRRGAS